MSKFERDISKILRGSFILVHPLEEYDVTHLGNFQLRYKVGNISRAEQNKKNRRKFAKIQYCSISFS
jgi:hypothetical protein